MIYSYAVSYTIIEAEGVINKGTLGISYYKPCNNTMLKKLVKDKMAFDKKGISINIEKVDYISEEESLRRFGNSLLFPGRRR